MFVMTLRRLGWKADSAYTVVNDEGVKLDFRVASPALIGHEVEAGAKRQLLRGLKLWGEGGGVPWLEPIKALLAAAKKDKLWDFRKAGALRSVVAGSQWPQKRLAEAGLADCNLCLMCGKEVGTLRHRAFGCEASFAEADRPDPERHP